MNTDDLLECLEMALGEKELNFDIIPKEIQEDFIASYIHTAGEVLEKIWVEQDTRIRQVKEDPKVIDQLKLERKAVNEPDFMEQFMLAAAHDAMREFVKDPNPDALRTVFVTLSSSAIMQLYRESKDDPQFEETMHAMLWGLITATSETKAMGDIMMNYFYKKFTLSGHGSYEQ